MTAKNQDQGAPEEIISLKSEEGYEGADVSKSKEIGSENPPSKLVINQTMVILVRDNVEAIVSGDKITFLPECIFFYSLNSVSKIGIRNACPECKTAVINVNYPNSPSRIFNVRMPGNTSREADITGTSSLQLIDTIPC